MQEKSVSRNELMMSFKALQGKFEKQKNDVKTKELAFDQLRDDFAEQLRYRERNLGLLIGNENPLRALADDLSGRLSATRNGWERQVAGRKKGTQFREGFGDSLLVFIYGKVKSGKSSWVIIWPGAIANPRPNSRLMYRSRTTFRPSKLMWPVATRRKRPRRVCNFG